MPNLKSLWLLPAFVAAFLLIGSPFWDIPYSQVSVPNSLVAPGLIGLVVLTVFLTAFEVASPRRIFLIMSLCLPVVVYARVEVETGRDPTSHNLWPFEVVFALFLVSSAFSQQFSSANLPSAGYARALPDSRHV